MYPTIRDKQDNREIQYHLNKFKLKTAALQ